MKTKFSPIVPLFAVFGLLLSGCENQQVGFSQAYQAVPVTGGAGYHRAYAYDPFYYYSGSIFPYRDFYGYARPPFYVSAGPYHRFGDDDDHDQDEHHHSDSDRDDDSDHGNSSGGKSEKSQKQEKKEPVRISQTKKPAPPVERRTRGSNPKDD